MMSCSSASVVLDELAVDQCLPYLITDHGHLIVGERRQAVAELDYVRILVHQGVKLLIVDLLTINLADTLVALGLCVGKRTHEFLGDECKEGKSDNDNDDFPIAANFL